MPKVYRIEVDGQGLFTAYARRYLSGEALSVRGDIVLAHRNLSYRPSAWCDFDDFTPLEDFCACESIKALKVWFEGFWDELLHHEEFQIVEYTARKIKKSKSGLQVLFTPSIFSDKKILDKATLTS